MTELKVASYVNITGGYAWLADDGTNVPDVIQDETKKLIDLCFHNKQALSGKFSYNSKTVFIFSRYDDSSSDDFGRSGTVLVVVLANIDHKADTTQKVEQLLLAIQQLRESLKIDNVRRSSSILAIIGILNTLKYELFSEYETEITEDEPADTTPVVTRRYGLRWRLRVVVIAISLLYILVSIAFGMILSG